MQFIKAVQVSHAPMAGLAMVGLFWGGFAALMPDIKAQAGVSDGTFGLLMMLSATGGIFSMFLAPRLVGWLGRWTLPVAGAVLVAAFFFAIFGTSAARLGIALLFMGASVGMMDICSNIRISAIEADHDKGLMNINHAMFSFAFALAALLTGPAREAGLGPAQILPFLALLAAILLFVTIEKAGRFRPAAQEAGGEGAARPGTGLWPVVALTALVLFASFIGENSTEAWSALHIERTLGAEVGHGSFGPAVLGLVMGLARAFGQLAADRIGERNLIAISAVLGVAGALLIAAAWAPSVVLVGVGIVALGMAVIVPSANTVLGRRVPKALHSLALSRAWMGGMTGFFVGPAAMGLVAEFFGLRIAYVVIAGVMALIIPAIFALGRIPRVGPAAAAPGRA